MKKTGMFILLLLVSMNAQAQNLQLFWADTDPSNGGATFLSGSTQGGTMIYINGLGFSTMAENNKIFVGNYPCLIPADGSTETSITCMTSSTGSNIDQSGLVITVYSNGEQQAFPPEAASYSYQASSTPIIHELDPASSIAGAFINYFGMHVITNLGNGFLDVGDVRSMYIGTSQCGRFNIAQPALGGGNSVGSIRCQQALIQEAGKYNVS